MYELTVYDGNTKRMKGVPRDARQIQETAVRCRKLVTKRALLSAGASVLPIPGADVAIDISLMIGILNSINKEFGLSPKQIELLSTEERLRMFEIITTTGSAWAGRYITKTLVAATLQKLSVKLTAAQTSKLIPILGLAASAGISFGALKWIGNQHIKDCVRIATVFNEQGQPWQDS